MKTAIATIKGVSPYSQSKHYSTEKLPKELAKDYETRTWRDRLHATDDGTVFIPPMSFKNCLSEAAKFLSLQIPGKGKATYTKHFEAGVLVTDALHLDIKKDDVPGEWLFVPADGSVLSASSGKLRRNARRRSDSGRAPRFDGMMSLSYRSSVSRSVCSSAAGKSLRCRSSLSREAAHAFASRCVRNTLESRVPRTEIWTRQPSLWGMIEAIVGSPVGKRWGLNCTN